MTNKRKSVWIMNHYAGMMHSSKGGRHYSIAKYLKRIGYDPVVFCCNVDHGSGSCFLPKKKEYQVIVDENIDVPFVFVDSNVYRKNDHRRVANMVNFYRNLKKAARLYAQRNGNPDIVIASSVHPLTLVAGLQIAKKFGVKCISEVRDLWPESLVAYSNRLTKNNPLIKLLYSGERWIYKKSDAVVMTWPGGFQYIKDKGWENEIPKEKVIHIRNGVDLEDFNRNLKYGTDSELPYPGKKHFVYAGSIRRVNNLELLVEAADCLKKQGCLDAMIVVYGDGDEREKLTKMAEVKNLDNICFCGKVGKDEIPYLLSRSYATILHNASTSLDKYGQSQNKFFEYLASGRPVLMTYSVGFSVCRGRHCGIELDSQSAQSIAQGIKWFCQLSDSEYGEMCGNANAVAHEYDYFQLTRRYVELIESLTDCRY